MCVWIGAKVANQVRETRARRENDAASALAAWRALGAWVRLEHMALLAALVSGAMLTAQLGWHLGTARWFGVKLGLVAFLLLPLEGMHAYVWNVWIRRGLLASLGSSFARDLERGLGMAEMLRALGLVLLGAGVPLLAWLSLAKPF